MCTRLLLYRNCLYLIIQAQVELSNKATRATLQAKYKAQEVLTSLVQSLPPFYRACLSLIIKAQVQQINKATRATLIAQHQTQQVMFGLGIR